MHGRVKVRTSEEEKARKERERQEKLQTFKHAAQKILLKRQQGEQDLEQLELTGKVLSSNPDIYTLWNIRREILIYFSKTKPNEDDMSKVYDAELSLTEYCLKINPKSYCAWHQREWVLTTRPTPDWQKELSLCNTYLKLDERNFHTWDYRRFVVNQCKPPLQDEFGFTTEKIHDNFSNYSAWHYRSKMLLALYPDLEGGRPIQDSYHKNELKMVQSAAFTDPDDTSAWFYQRWLLDAVKTTVQPVVCAVTPSKVTVAFNKFVSIDFINTRIVLTVNGESVDGKWLPCTGYDNDDLWILNHKHEITDNLDVELEFSTDSEEKQIIKCTKTEQSSYLGFNCISFQNKYSAPVLEELNDQLSSCRQLLDLEPDNKWTLLTLTVFLYCIDAKTYHAEVITNLHKLIQVDSHRAGYYNDLISKWSIEQQLMTDYRRSPAFHNLKINFDEKITTLSHLQYYSYCKTVDLSNQNLSSKVLGSLIKLQHCKELNLSNNILSSLKGFPLLQLNKLFVIGNIELKLEEIRRFKEEHQFVEIIY